MASFSFFLDGFENSDFDKSIQNSKLTRQFSELPFWIISKNHFSQLEKFLNLVANVINLFLQYI